MTIFPLFSIPLYINSSFAGQNKLDLNDINQRLYNLEWERVKNSNPNYIPKGSTTTNKDILQLNQFSDVFTAINQEMQNYLFNELGIDNHNIELVCNRSWSMMHKQGDYSRQHCHENCLWSGIFYTKISQESGGLIFYRDMSRYTWILPSIKPNIKKDTPYTSTEIYVTPAVGSIIIFPGFVSHGTPPNETLDDRLNIVFNYSLKGTFGDNYFERQVI